MRKLLTSSIIALSFAFTGPALAKKSVESSTTVSQPLTSAVKIEIALSEDLEHRAENLPKKFTDRSGSRINAAFANNGFYGNKDLDLLKQRLRSKIERKFAKKGIEISDDAPAVLKVTISEVKPNRPTHEQLKRDANLSFSSRGVGGADIESELFAADGSSLGSINYRWFETDFFQAQFLSLIHI